MIHKNIAFREGRALSSVFGPLRSQKVKVSVQHCLLADLLDD